MTNEFSLYESSRKNWKDYVVKPLGPCPIVWANSQWNYDWVETFSIGQIPVDNQWNNPGTRFKLYQEDLYVNWGHVQPATQHFVSYDPELDFDIDPILNIIGCDPDSYSLNFIRVPAGRMIPWHCDTYAWFVQHHHISQNQLTHVKRALVFVDDWRPGQIVQFGKDVLSHWRNGDAYTWAHDCWHGAANFGDTDLTVMLITYYDKTSIS